MLANHMVCLKQISFVKARYLLILIVMVIPGVMSQSNSIIDIKVKVATFLKCIEKMRKLLINLDFSKNYSNQNEIQRLLLVITLSVCFRHVHFTRTKTKPKKSIKSDKWRATSVSCVDFLIQFLRCEIEGEIDKIDIFSDGCAAQFRSRYVFCLLTEIQKDVDIVLDYFTPMEEC